MNPTTDTGTNEETPLPPPTDGEVRVSGGQPAHVVNPNYKGAPEAPTLANADGKFYAKHVEERNAEKVAEEERFKNKLIEQGLNYPGLDDGRARMVGYLALCGPVRAVKDLVKALDDAAECARRREQPITHGKLKAQADELRPMIFRMAELETLGR